MLCRVELFVGDDWDFLSHHLISESSVKIAYDMESPTPCSLVINNNLDYKLKPTDALRLYYIDKVWTGVISNVSRDELNNVTVEFFIDTHILNFQMRYQEGQSLQSLYFGITRPEFYVMEVNKWLRENKNPNREMILLTSSTFGFPSMHYTFKGDAPFIIDVIIDTATSLTITSNIVDGKLYLRVNAKNPNTYTANNPLSRFNIESFPFINQFTLTENFDSPNKYTLINRDNLNELSRVIENNNPNKEVIEYVDIDNFTEIYLNEKVEELLYRDVVIELEWHDNLCIPQLAYPRNIIRDYISVRFINGEMYNTIATAYEIINKKVVKIKLGRHRVSYTSKLLKKVR
jgi:hypothetical protein